MKCRDAPPPPLVMKLFLTFTFPSLSRYFPLKSYNSCINLYSYLKPSPLGVLNRAAFTRMQFNARERFFRFECSNAHLDVDGLCVTPSARTFILARNQQRSAVPLLYSRSSIQFVRSCFSIWIFFPHVPFHHLEFCSYSTRKASIHILSSRCRSSSAHLAAAILPFLPYLILPVTSTMNPTQFSSVFPFAPISLSLSFSHLLIFHIPLVSQSREMMLSSVVSPICPVTNPQAISISIWIWASSGQYKTGTFVIFYHISQNDITIKI